MELCGVVDREQGGKKVLPNVTRETLRRSAATRAAKTCVAETAAAVARAQADGNTTLVDAASAYSLAATDLRDADPEKKGDMHILLRAAEASYRASVASAKAVGNDAVAVAQKLVEASNAFDVAAKAVVDAVDFDTKLEARGDLEAAEDALKDLFISTEILPAKPGARKTAHRPRPNTCTDRLVQQTRRRVAGAPAEEAMWHMRGLPRRGVRRVQVLPRHDKARRPGRAEEQALRPAGVFSAESAEGAEGATRHLQGHRPGRCQGLQVLGRF